MHQDVYAAYVTYERPFGDFTVQGGLRAEQVQIDLNDVTHGLKADNSYFKVYPTLHTGYRLSDSHEPERQLQPPRPAAGAQDLHPYRVYIDPYNYRQGNPNLKPQIADSSRAGLLSPEGPRPPTWPRPISATSATALGLDVVSDLGDGVFLTTRENLGKGRTAGELELVANGPRPTKTLTRNLSGDDLLERDRRGQPGLFRRALGHEPRLAGRT
ncbi:TonB-dependent receptor domain-containing protein [Caulobacter segnis]